MFLNFYRLREHPFGVTPDPRYLYLSPSHREALASLFYGIETRRGFLALLASPGMGKTTLLFQLLERLKESDRSAFLFQTQCDSREFLRYLLEALGLDSHDSDPVRIHRQLNEFLFREALAGRRVVVIIDEAQNLSDSVLETVRLLSDFEAPDKKLLQIVLAGQSELARRLLHSELGQLRQRIAVRASLDPLPPAEVVRYVNHRLHVAGYDGPELFTPAALALIAERSQGVPRNINNICFNALSIGCAAGRKRIGPEVVQEAASDLSFDTLVQVREATPPAAAEPAVTQQFSLSTQEAGMVEPPVVSRTIQVVPPAPPIAEPCEDEQGTAPVATSLPVEEKAERELRQAKPYRAPVIALVVAGMLTAALAGSGWYWWRGRAQETATNLIRQSADGGTPMNVLPVAMAQTVPSGSSRVPEASKTIEVSIRPLAAAPLQPKPVGAFRRAPEPSGAGPGRFGGPAGKPAESLETANATRKTPVISDLHLATPPAKHATSPAKSPEAAAGNDSAPVVASVSSAQAPATLLGGSSFEPVAAKPQPHTAPVGELSSEPAAAKPEPRTGGELKTARLVSSVPPVYPPLARSQRVEGDVTLDALIDGTGRITTIQVVSGPVLLQQAAAAAVRQWKYEPATLNGSPVPIHLAVTVKFRLR